MGIARDLDAAMRRLVEEKALGVQDFQRYSHPNFAFTPAQQSSQNPAALAVVKKRAYHSSPEDKKRKRLAISVSLKSLKKKLDTHTRSIDAYALEKKLKPHHAITLVGSIGTISEQEAEAALAVLVAYQQQRHRSAVAADQDGAFGHAVAYAAVIPMQVADLKPVYHNCGADQFTARCIQSLADSFHCGDQKRRGLISRVLHPRKRHKEAEDEGE